MVQDPKAPTRFVMLEVYKDDDAIKAHQESAHFKDFRPVIGELIADRKVEVLHMVSDGKTKRCVGVNVIPAIACGRTKVGVAGIELSTSGGASR